MRIQHRVPGSALTNNMTGRIDADYQREIDRSTVRLQREYDQEQVKFEAARRRAERLSSRRETSKSSREQTRLDREVRIACEQVELRREELARLAALMQSSPAGSTNRGDRSYRPVPVRHGANF